MLSGHNSAAWNYHVSWNLQLPIALSLQANLSSITGTPSGIGWARKPRLTLHGGDEFVVEILPHIGSLYNVMEDEK